METEDRYEITINTTFETNVPSPVVTMSPTTIDVGSLKNPGDKMQVDITLTNQGWITAPDTELHFDNHPMYKFTPLIEYIGDMSAKSSMVIPVVVERIAGGAPVERVAAAIQAGGKRLRRSQLCPSGGGRLFGVL